MRGYFKDKLAHIGLSLLIAAVLLMPHAAAVDNRMGAAREVIASLFNGAAESLVSGDISIGEVFDLQRNPFRPSLGYRDWQQAGWGGGGGYSYSADLRTTTIIVAASNSYNRYMADLLCDNTNDYVQLQAADDIADGLGGKVFCLAGSYALGAGNLTVESWFDGEGGGDQTTDDNVGTVFNIVSGQNVVWRPNGNLTNLRVKAGNLAAATSPIILMEPDYTADTNIIRQMGLGEGLVVQG